MNCPNCGTYNPDDRTVCWRCDKELPKPQPEKKKNPQKTAQIWLYIIVALFFIFTTLQTCGVKLPWSQQQGPQQSAPSGYAVPQAPLAGPSAGLGQG
jgi:predicted nucleic acid-binding Zn ribbon protein